MNQPPVQILDGALACPVCRESLYLHHSATRVLNRIQGEDSDGVRISAPGGFEFSLKLVPFAEIPGRRDSVEIDFWCETCSRWDAKRTVGTLRIMQHKGATQLTWESVAAPL